MSRRAIALTSALMLRAYRHGLFPMAETRDSDRLYWLDPEQRGVLPLEIFRIPRRLGRTVLSGPYDVSVDTHFAEVIAGCAMPAPGRGETWINPQIEQLFTQLHREGHAHSVETWHDDELVGGLYGVAIGGAFFGESMFSIARDASKVALAHLVARLRLGGFTLLDTQFVTAHLTQFGATEIPRAAYRALLDAAIQVNAHWIVAPHIDDLRTQIRALMARGGAP